MNKSKVTYRTHNGKVYNQALINRGSPTFWSGEEAIEAAGTVQFTTNVEVELSLSNVPV